MAVSIDQNHRFRIEPRRETLFGPNSNKVPVAKSQLQAIGRRDLQDVAKGGENMNQEIESASSKSDFMRLAGFGPELAEFVIEFVEKPEMLFSMSFERRYEIENQMDAILSSFEQG